MSKQVVFWLDRKHIVVAAIVAMIMSVFVGCEEAYTPALKKPIGVSAPTSTEIEALSEQIKQSVTELEYSDKVAEDFVNMVISWKDKQRRPVLIVWEKKLAKVKEDHKQGRISIDQLAKAEESIAKELSQRIKKELSYNEKFFDLSDVIKHKQAQCISYAQLFYILGNSIGLSVKGINVVRPVTGALPPEVGHTACIVSLANSKTLMVDLALEIVGVSKVFVSKPFKLEKEFRKVGNYWEFKDKDNPLKLHRRVQIIDRNGLIASIYNNRGNVYRKLGQYDKAISDYNRAIELDPEYAKAYNNRGVTYADLGQYDKAISDYNRAIELDPEMAVAYNSRGVTYADLGQHDKAISNYTRAIELNPEIADVYYNRGNVNFRLGQYDKAISDYSKAIKLNPTLAPLAQVYYNRGSAYGILGQHDKAISDYTRTIELNPKNADAYRNRGLAYTFLEKTKEAKKDFAKAVELRPAYKASIKEILQKKAKHVIPPGTKVATFDYIIGQWIIPLQIDSDGVITGSVPTAAMGARLRLCGFSYDAYKINVIVETDIKGDKFKVDNDASIRINGKEQKGVEFITYRAPKELYAFFLFNGSIIRIGDDELFIDEGRGFFYYKTTFGEKGSIDRRSLDENGSFITTHNTYYITEEKNTIPKEGIFEISDNKVVIKEGDIKLENPRKD